MQSTPMFEHIPLVLAQDDPPPVNPKPAVQENGGNAVEGQATPDGGDSQNAPPPSGGANWIFPLMIGMLVLMIIMSTGGQRKERKRRAELIASMKKGDKVVTRGGILGTIVEVREKDVVLKVDENSNTRIKFDKAAIEMVTQEKETKD